MLTMAPPHSACSPLTTLGFTLKIFSHNLKCGEMRRKAAHDDECRDVEEGIGGYIMKIDPVVVHKAANEWVEGKP